MTSQTAIGSSKVPLALPFGTLAIGNGGGTLIPQFSVPSVVEYTMPKGGWVIGMGVHLSGSLTTGTLQFYPTLNGAAMANQFVNGTVNIGTLGNYERDQAQQGGFQFFEGDTLGLAFNKTGTVAPTTRDCVGLLLVLLNNYDY